jgi:hypothetical protein
MCAPQLTGTISAGSEGLTGRGNLFTVLFSVGDREVAQDLVAKAFCPGADVLADGQQASGDASAGGPHRAEPDHPLAAAAATPTPVADPGWVTDLPSVGEEPTAPPIHDTGFGDQVDEHLQMWLKIPSRLCARNGRGGSCRPDLG